LYIRIADIKADPLCLDFVEAVSRFPVLQKLEKEGKCTFLRPITVDVRAVLVGGLIELVGRVETEVEVPCSRCLNPATVAVDALFELCYVRDLPEIDDESNEEGSELTAEDMGLIQFEGDEIDLAEAVEEQVLLALPLSPLCDKDCRGLCSRCGANRNNKNCGCTSQDFNLKFAALNNLKLDK
jgi:DUF177 domain-containing protein